MLEKAEAPIDSARLISASNPEGAYQLAYDAARKAICAHMASVGLTTRSMPGAHVAVGTYGLTLNEMVFRPFDRMRTNRHDAEYGTREFRTSELERDIASAESMIDVVRELLGDNL